MDQHEFPGRATLPDAVLCSRRARVLALATSVFAVGVALVPLLNTSKLFGVSWIMREVGLEPSVMMLLPIGALALPFALLASNLVNELFGRSRGLLFGALFAWVGVLGLTWATDHLRAFDNTTTNSFWIALALVGSTLVTCIVQIETFAWIGARWLRHFAAPIFGLVAGFGVFALIVTQLDIPGAPIGDDLLGLALGTGGFAVLVVLACTPIVMTLSRALAIYTRVELQPAAVEPDEFTDVEDASSEPAFMRDHQRAWTSQEMAFFEAGESKPGMSRFA